MHVGIAHDAALADAGPARLELRLHQQHEVGVGVACSATSAGATVTSEMKERSATVSVDRAAEVVGLERAHVGALAHGDPRVVAQRPGELAAADVDRVRRGRRRAAAGSR